MISASRQSWLKSHQILFTKIKKATLKYVQGYTKDIESSQNNFERIKLSDFLTEFKTSKSTETKTWFQCKDTQKNETEWISEINLNSFGRLIPGWKALMHFLNRESIDFSTNGAKQLDIGMEKRNLKPCLIHKNLFEMY